MLLYEKGNEEFDIIKTFLQRDWYCSWLTNELNNFKWFYLLLKGICFEM